jgi:hypothetical protein
MSILEEHLKNLNWPDKKKSLFSKRKDWWNFARIEITSMDEGLSIYSQAYKDAADRLVEHTQSDRTSLNFMVFPILFLYRHYIELALKEIILSASEYLEKEQKNTNIHTLSKLWEEAKKLIFEVDLEIPNDEIIAIENQILQFHKLDKSSETFRYPFDRQGNVFKNLSDYINIENVREIVDGLHAWCFGLVCVLSEYQVLKNQY